MYLDLKRCDQLYSEDEENELNKTMSQIGGSMQESFANAVADIRSRGLRHY